MLEIPVSAKKRLVILKWLVEFFEPGISYPESQVNVILELHHHDCATLRREMVGYRMLTRHKGIDSRGPESERVTGAK
ncbi:MAG: DUF2087 domain-containing protein [Candidatus Binatus sp.]